MENEIMKFEEVMEFLNIGKNTLYILLNSGRNSGISNRKSLENTKKIS